MCKNSFWKYGPGASVVGHCGGTMATLRAEDVCIWPSEVGANCVQSSFGLAQEPGPLRRNVPSPRSLKPKQVNTGFVSAAAPVSSPFGAVPFAGVGAVDLPSRWQELQFAFPRQRL